MDYRALYHLGSFSLGGAFVYLTLGGYTPQVLCMSIAGVVSYLAGLFFKKYTK